MFSDETSFHGSGIYEHRRPTTLTSSFPEHTTIGLQTRSCHENFLLITIQRNWSPEETYYGSDHDFMLTCSSKHSESLNVDWTLFVLKSLPILRCKLVSLKLREVNCKPQQVAFVYLNLLKNRVVLNPRWNFVDSLYIHTTSFKSLCS